MTGLRDRFFVLFSYRDKNTRVESINSLVGRWSKKLTTSPVANRQKSNTSESTLEFRLSRSMRRIYYYIANGAPFISEFPKRFSGMAILIKLYNGNYNILFHLIGWHWDSNAITMPSRVSSETITELRIKFQLILMTLKRSIFQWGLNTLHSPFWGTAGPPLNSPLEVTGTPPIVMRCGVNYVPI